MALRRISHKHTEEQVGRGFNIMTNGEELPNGLKIIRDQNTEYLKNPTSTWQHISTGAATSACSSKPMSSAAQIPNVELQRTQFGDRSNRITLLGRTGGSASQAPSSKRSEIRSGGFQQLGAQLAK